MPIVPAYSLSKAAALNLTQSLRTQLKGQGVTVHAVVLGPVDTEMSRGFRIPKASPAAAVQGIFDGLENGEDKIFPDPTSQSIAEGWRSGVLKTLEREFSHLPPPSAAMARLPTWQPVAERTTTMTIKDDMTSYTVDQIFEQERIALHACRS